MSVAKHNVAIVNGLIGHQYSNVAATGSIESPCMFSQGALLFIDYNLALTHLVPLLKKLRAVLNSCTYQLYCQWQSEQ